MSAATEILDIVEKSAETLIGATAPEYAVLVHVLKDLIGKGLVAAIEREIGARDFVIGTATVERPS